MGEGPFSPFSATRWVPHGSSRSKCSWHERFANHGTGAHLDVVGCEQGRKADRGRVLHRHAPHRHGQGGYRDHVHRFVCSNVSPLLSRPATHFPIRLLPNWCRCAVCLGRRTTARNWSQVHRPRRRVQLRRRLRINEWTTLHVDRRSSNGEGSC